MVGYDKNVATAVWIGSRDVKKRAIVDQGGSNIGGGTLPAQLWKRYMEQALKGYEPSDLPSVTGIGNEDAGNGVAPPPPPPENGQCEPTDLLCQLGGGNNNGGNNGGGRRGNNGPGGPGADSRPSTRRRARAVEAVVATDCYHRPRPIGISLLRRRGRPDTVSGRPRRLAYATASGRDDPRRSWFRLLPGHLIRQDARS